MRSVGVIGLGYVGLPLAVQATTKGYKVIGVDKNPRLIDTIKQGKSPYVNDERFEKALASIDRDKLILSTEINALKDVDTIIICVPTPTVNNAPDLSFVLGAAKEVASLLKKGQLVILESTVNPGVTRDEILPILEAGSSFKVGKDFFLAHCPERIDPGNPKFNVSNLNRVVGGITQQCTDRALDFYKDVIDAEILPLGSAEEAEFVKSWENSHRNVMIALANSAAIICDALGMSIDNILQGLQSKVDQFGLSLATPGLGPGGHCIPEDIHYVIKRARQSDIDTRFLDGAAELNDKMPSYAVHKLAAEIESHGEHLEDLGVALLGLAYKPDVADMRRSPSVELGYALLRKAKSITLHDPYINVKEISVKGSRVAKTLEEALKDNEVLCIGTAHKQYVDQLTPDLLKKHGIRYVLDGRNCLSKEAIQAYGISYQGIGK